MKAAIIKAHGGPENLVLVDDWARPTAGEGDVVIRVKASSLNYHDVFTRRGMPGIKLELPVVPGLDLAGEVVELGAGVTDVKVGDRVLVDPLNRVEGGLMGETMDGGLQEFARVRAHQLVPIPDGVTYEQAAALPVAYGTAYRMMFTNGQIKAGDKVLVLGASGGVGTGAVLLAKLAGAHVIACGSSEEKLAKLKEIGADEVIDYTQVDFAKEVYARFGKPHRRKYEGGVDVVVNFTGGDTWVKSLRALKRGGKLLTCGATAGFDPTEDLRFIWTFELKILGSNSWAREDLSALLGYIAEGKLKPVIDKVLPLEQSAEALRLIEERQVIGKVILAP
ncbi:zinc-binding dehydrogenase [Azorhizobium oxalatiphilum]|uniref:Zinc-binding dehydrogenase n=1 Tax=Azorhizobium oxalatiphilum TaxID=980631 RepID=A0A917FHX4_9HYPH|nr:SDR family NAD(P)-dependent oxidoreductase [Azorhizobium oxalatiphilum]GGF80367.1 zinc-binding dehydrogenase [Azorhizobium oxalatiphilum]